MSLNQEKFNNLVLFILKSDLYKEEGIKKLNKLLYFIDFYFYRDNERLITGARYAKARMGPVVDEYKKIFQQMVSDGILKESPFVNQIIYCANKEYDISVFAPEEVVHIMKVLEKYGKLSSSDLENISHEQQPWILTDIMGDWIDPDLALLMGESSQETIEVKNETLKKEWELYTLLP